MMMTIYRLTVAPILVFALLLASPFNRKIRGILKLKLRKRFPPIFAERPIWIHAASGEFEYAKSVIRELKLREPATPVLVTYTSSTYVDSIEAFPGVDFALPLPLDLPGPCRTFLKKYDPRCLLIARTDLWPEILHQTRSRNIPVLLFSYTQKPLDRMGSLAQKARSWLLEFVSEIRCVTTEDAANLAPLKPKAAVAVEGDTRYDQVRYRLDHPKELPEHMRPSLPALVAGSTWKEDETVLIEALDSLLKAKRTQLILVPHEPSESHIRALTDTLNSHGLTHELYSSGRPWSDKTVLIVDRVGILAELYPWADIAFVGGSFKRSVHSVMEPLGAGLLTLVGPHHLNNREATEFAKISVGAFTAVQPCSSAESLQRTMDLLLGGDKSSRQSEILKAFNSRLGASRKIIERIFDRKSVSRAASASPRTIHS